MKKIEVIIPPTTWARAGLEHLAVAGVTGMTISEVRGWGVRQAPTGAEQTPPGDVQVAAKMKVEMVVLANEAEMTMDRLADALRTNGSGRHVLESRRRDRAHPLRHARPSGTRMAVRCRQLSEPGP